VTKVGRPKSYTPEVIDIINAMGDEGEGMAEAIVAVGTSKATFYTWQDENPAFLNAVRDFRGRSQAWWERKGRGATFGDTPGFNATSFIFNMKNRFPDDWRDKQEVDNTHSLADPLTQLLSEVAKSGKRIGS
jgi:hypothetical protein